MFENGLQLLWKKTLMWFLPFLMNTVKEEFAYFIKKENYGFLPPSNFP